MFDPTAPNRCTCPDPDCTGRVLNGQRARTLNDPATTVAYVHPEDVLDYLNAAIAHVLALEGPFAAIGLPMTVTVGQLLADWMSQPANHVPANHVPGGHVRGTDALSEPVLDADLSADWRRRLDEALHTILDEG